MEERNEERSGSREERVVLREGMSYTSSAATKESISYVKSRYTVFEVKGQTPYRVRSVLLLRTGSVRAILREALEGHKRPRTALRECVGCWRTCGLWKWIGACVCLRRWRGV